MPNIPPIPAMMGEFAGPLCVGGLIHRGSEKPKLATVAARPVLLGGIAGEACALGPGEKSLLSARTLMIGGATMPAGRCAVA